MITDEKISEIRSKLKKGYPAGELRNGLAQEGYSGEEIDACFNGYRYSMKSWYLFFAILLVAAAAWFSSLLLASFAAVLLSLYFREKNK